MSPGDPVEFLQGNNRHSKKKTMGAQKDTRDAKLKPVLTPMPFGLRRALQARPAVKVVLTLPSLKVNQQGKPEGILVVGDLFLL